MKVSGKAGSPVQSEIAKLNKTTAEATGDAKKKSSAASAFEAGVSTKVDLSSRAQDIKKAKELATPRDNDIDEAKVARLQKMIDEGKYKVDAEAVADRLVDEHLLTSN